MSFWTCLRRLKFRRVLTCRMFQLGPVRKDLECPIRVSELRSRVANRDSIFHVSNAENIQILLRVRTSDDLFVGAGIKILLVFPSRTRNRKLYNPETTGRLGIAQPKGESIYVSHVACSKLGSVCVVPRTQFTVLRSLP